MVRSYLPTPDEYRKNPVIKSAKPMKMYLKKKVRDIEETKAFKDRLTEAQKRSKAARKVADSKRKDLLGEVDDIEITVAPLSPNLAQRYAIESYNSRKSSCKQAATDDSDKRFLDRITVNYLRHNETRYDSHIHALFGKVGKQEAYWLLKGNVLDEIAKEFPNLAPECERQKSMIG